MSSLVTKPTVFLELTGLLHSLVEKMSVKQPTLNSLPFVHLKLVFHKKISESTLITVILKKTNYSLKNPSNL